jgi:hypothetical protein
MRKQGFVLAVTKVAMLVAMLTIGLSFLSCDNGTTRGAALSGTYFCQAPSSKDDYITFWTNGTYELRDWGSYYSEEGTYSVIGGTIFTTIIVAGFQEWTYEWGRVVDGITIRDNENGYIWKK